jgi:hypothetical protein
MTDAFRPIYSRSEQQHSTRERNLLLARQLVNALVLFQFMTVLLFLSMLVGPVRFYTSDVGLAIFLAGTAWITTVIPVSGEPIRMWGLPTRLLFSLFAIILLTNVFTYHPQNSLNASLNWLRASLFYWALTSLARRDLLTFKTISMAAFWSWCLEAAVGSIQIVTKQPIGLVANYFGTSANEQVDYSLSAADLVWRVSGTHHHPIVFGLWIATLAMLGYAFLGGKRGGWAKLMRSLILPTTGLLLFASLTRGTLVFFIAELGVFYLCTIISTKRINIYLVGAGCAILLAAAWYAYHVVTSSRGLGNLFVLATRFSQSEDDLRWNFIRQGFTLLRHRPLLWLTGTGSDAMYPAALQEGVYDKVTLNWQNLSNTAFGIHNMYLKMLVENGVVAGFLFALLHIRVVLRALGRAFTGGTNDAVLASITVGWFLAFSVYMEIYQPEYSLFMVSVIALIAMPAVQGMPQTSGAHS